MTEGQASISTEILARYAADAASEVEGVRSLAGRRGVRVEVRAGVPSGTAAGWRSADPDGGEHDVVNCSIASLAIELVQPRGPRRTLVSEHGGAYELGMRRTAGAREDGVAFAPFADG